MAESHGATDHARSSPSSDDRGIDEAEEWRRSDSPLALRSRCVERRAIEVSPAVRDAYGSRGECFRILRNDCLAEPLFPDNRSRLVAFRTKDGRAGPHEIDHPSAVGEACLDGRDVGRDA